MRWFVSSFACAVCLVALTVLAEDKPAPSPPTPLFNGTNLDGWEGDPDLWHVAGGAIVGNTEGKKLGANSFLATKKHYKNLVLKAKFKLRNHNSGIQFRSKLFDNYVVRGYQADIADNQYMGILYEEGGRGILADVTPAFTAKVTPEEVAKHVHPGDWNEYVITADGPHITQTINGFKTVDYTETSDKGATEGIIALQLHAGPPMQVEFKDIEITELP
ncbi:MAG TPA: DUF1080 domain-containing protein [Pirellulales bacterium]|nr:DUF1080 domain-containing protein [Pirellulales bacterium]